MTYQLSYMPIIWLAIITFSFHLPLSKTAPTSQTNSIKSSDKKLTPEVSISTDVPYITIRKCPGYLDNRFECSFNNLDGTYAIIFSSSLSISSQAVRKDQGIISKNTGNSQRKLKRVSLTSQVKQMLHHFDEDFFEVPRFMASISLGLVLMVELSAFIGPVRHLVKFLC